MNDDAFSPDWLALREPVDHRSRSTELLPPLRKAWEARGWQRILDLGSGTGSNVRFLSPQLPGPQRWHLVDHDADLLERAVAPPSAGPLVRTVGSLEVEGIAAVADADLVTASALFDLVDEAWLDRLVAACRASGCGLYVALTYDGTMHWSDAAGGRNDDADDEMIRRAVNDHQRRERGRRAALGPAAGRIAERRFAEAGFRTWRSSSPWQLGPADADLAVAFIEGLRHAALELEPDPRTVDRIEAWAERRSTATTGRFALIVGHDDLLALPSDGEVERGLAVDRRSAQTR